MLLFCFVFLDCTLSLRLEQLLPYWLQKGVALEMLVLKEPQGDKVELKDQASIASLHNLYVISFVLSQFHHVFLFLAP